jgi:hypothetical protein
MGLILYHVQDFYSTKKFKGVRMRISLVRTMSSLG